MSQTLDVWRAEIFIGGLTKTLGQPPTWEQVLGAVLPWQVKYHPGFGHLHTALRKVQEEEESREAGEATVS